MFIIEISKCFCFYKGLEHYFQENNPLAEAHLKFCFFFFYIKSYRGEKKIEDHNSFPFYNKVIKKPLYSV